MSPRILFVDDEAQIRELLSLFLSGNGMQVSLAGTGAEARELLEQNPFDITILDLNLAGEDGLDVLNFIKSRWPKHPVIVFTGVADDEFFLKKALADRADGFVRKMSGLSSVLKTVRELLPKKSPTGPANPATPAN